MKKAGSSGELLDLAVFTKGANLFRGSSSGSDAAGRRRSRMISSTFTNLGRQIEKSFTDLGASIAEKTSATFSSSSSSSSNEILYNRREGANRLSQGQQLASAEGDPRDMEDSFAEMIAEVHENQRNSLALGWTHNNLFPDEHRYEFAGGQTNAFPSEVPLEPGWEYEGNWEIDYEVEGSSGGWRYGKSFDDIEAGKLVVDITEAKCRRLRWIRFVRQATDVLELQKQQSMQQQLLQQGPYSTSSAVEAEEEEYVITEKASPGNPNPSPSPGSDARGSSQGSRATSPVSMVSAESDDTNDSSINNDMYSEFVRKIVNSNNTPEASFIIPDTGLAAINKQIQLTEAFCRKDDEHSLDEWKRLEKPQLEAHIKELERRCLELQMQMESDMHMGFEHINAIEKDFKAHAEVLESVKKRYYFPRSPVVVGQQGVYAGLDDIWCEHASGHFVLDFIPTGADMPQINLLLTSSGSEPNENGISIRVMVDKFKLAGDKGKGIPKIEMESIKLSIVLIVTITIHFDARKNKWIINSNKNFDIKLISFKGPYGLSKSVVSLILSVLSPTLKSQILKLLPHELGVFIKSLPSPFCIRGEFNISGTDIKLLSTPLSKSPFVCQAMGCSPQQMALLQLLQKSMDRKEGLLVTMADVLKYIKISRCHPQHWTTIMHLWRQACKIYTSVVMGEWGSHGSRGSGNGIIDFEAIVNLAHEINKKKITIKFTLQHIDGNVSVHRSLTFAHTFFKRVAMEANENSDVMKKARMMIMLEKIQSNYEKAVEIVEIISKNLDYADLKVNGLLKSGERGSIRLMAREVRAQAPVLLHTALPDSEHILYTNSFVPCQISVSPSDDGESARIKMKHIERHDAGADGGALHHTIFSLAITRPQGKVVADKAMVVEEGAELLRFSLGGGGGDLRAPVPVKVDTAPGIKVIADVPKALLDVKMDNLMRYLKLHFDDLDALRVFLNRTYKGNYLYEQLMVGQLVLQRLKKYLLADGLEVDLNFDCKVVTPTSKDDIIVSVRTPKHLLNGHVPESLLNRGGRDGDCRDDCSDSDERGSSMESTTGNSRKGGKKFYVVKLEAAFNFKDLLEDSLAIENSVRYAFERMIDKED